jgi:DNA-binding MarR family transcriptional regulator
MDISISKEQCQSVRFEKLIAALSVLRQRPVSVVELCELIQYSKASTHKLIRLLEALQLVKVPKRSRYSEKYNRRMLTLEGLSESNELLNVTFFLSDGEDGKPGEGYRVSF